MDLEKTVMNRSILEGPELAALIAEYLPQHAILQCMLASKRLFHVFKAPFFRRIVICPPPPSDVGEVVHKKWKSLAKTESEVSKGLRRHLQDIRHLELTYLAGDFLRAMTFKTRTRSNIDTAAARCSPTVSDSKVKTMPIFEGLFTVVLSRTHGCTELKRLKVLFEPDFQNPSTPFFPNETLLDLLMLNVNLVELCLSPQVLVFPDTAQNFIEILNTGLPCLRVLSIIETGEEQLPLDKYFVLLHASLRHKSLQDFQCVRDLSHSRSLSFDKMTAPHIAWQMWQGITVESSQGHIPTHALTESAIKTLMVPWYIPMNVYIHILKTCVPALTKVNIPCLQGESASEVVAALQGHYARLQHLVVGDRNFAFRVSDDHLSELLRSLKGVNEGGLRSIDLTWVRYTKSVVGALLEHHETLEDVSFFSFVFEDYRKASGGTQQLLSTCSHLTRFSICNEGLPQTFDYKDRVVPWVCANLRSLHLFLDPDVMLESPKPQAVRQILGLEYSRSIYSRIGALTKLEDLELRFGRYYEPRVLRGTEVDLKVDIPQGLNLACGLQELKDLKRLHRLKLDVEMWQGVGQEDCEFMAREWTSLEQIEFDCCTVQEFSQADGKAEYWQWFKANRPDVRLTCKHSCVRL